MPRRSRLSRKTVRTSQKNLILSVLGIAAILFLLIRYGIPLLSDVSYLFGRVTSKSSTSTTKETQDSYVAPPAIDSLPEATKDKNITVTGTSLSGEKVILYLNGLKYGQEDISSDRGFSFEVVLTEGDNTLKAKAIKGDNQSEYSDTVNISYKNKEPNLSIDNPHDGDNLSGGNTVTVSGKADPDNTVTFNGFQAIIDNQGNWSYSLALTGGGNDIKAIATDPAGNQAQKSTHVNYSQ
jgi:hypothetical protein